MDLGSRVAKGGASVLVCLASAAFMVVSTHFVYFQNYGKDDLVAVDTSRIAASVVSGVGLPGGRGHPPDGLERPGLTTAASLRPAAAGGWRPVAACTLSPSR